MARRIFLHLYMMRVPLVVLFTLGFLVAPALQSPMLHGLADLETNQIAIVSLGAFLLLSAAMTCCFLVLLYGSARADGNRQPPAPNAHVVDLPRRLPLSGWAVGLLYLAGSSCFLRFLLAVEHTMESAHVTAAGLWPLFWGRAGIGVAIGILLLGCVFFADLWLGHPRGAPEIEVFALPFAYLFRDSEWVKQRLRRVSDAQPLGNLKLGAFGSRWTWLGLRLVRILGPGYGHFDESGHPTEFYPGHGFATILAGASFVFYLLAGRGTYRQLVSDAPFRHPRMYDAVLLQVIVLLLLACWFVSALAFFFDRFRMPVLVPAAAILWLTSYLGPSDKAFHTIERNSHAGESLETPAERFAKTQQDAILIAAAGGGIQAAAWTSEVLCGLRRELGSSFDQRVVAVSGVSGGSVGAMFYLRCRESAPGDMQGAEAARRSSLEAIAWGLAHPDLRRAVLPVELFSWPGADTGWALERALRKNAQFSPMNRPLATPELQQNWPVVLFNATEVRTGDPIVFTNSKFPVESPRNNPNHALHGFHTVYAGRDVWLETAVRMSAAFPYVSPAARADTPWNADHLVDGGYFDNSGLFTLGEWLKQAAPDLRQAPNENNPSVIRKKILVLRIDAFPDATWNGPADRPRKWPYQLTAPLLAVLHVRSEGQLVRDISEGADLLEMLGQRGYDATTITARYVPLTGMVKCPSDPPLTWHLTEVEKVCIEQSWDDMKLDLISRINTFFTSPPTARPEIAPSRVTTEPVRKGLYIQRLEKR